ncbi:MAG TPA: hypothetical protein VF691_03610 [Cytophagaceae bacterium]
MISRFRYILTSLCLSIISTAIALFYFDFSWDGQWYHQEAIYALESGWNPFTNSLRSFAGHNDNSVRHFPKLSWYYASAFYSMTGHLEGGKSMNIILLFAALILIYVTLRRYNFSNVYSFLSAAVCLNPVVSSEVVTYLSDGNL